MAYKIFPIGDRVAVLPDDPIKLTPGGIAIPETATEKPTRGKVVAVGPGSRNQMGGYNQLTLNVGDIVTFPKYTGQHIEVGDVVLVILREDELLLRLVEE